MPIVIDVTNDPYYREGKLEGKIESAITFIKDFHLPISEIQKYLDNSKLSKEV